MIPKFHFVVEDKQEIFTCGDNRHGKLGLDQKKFNSIQFYPHLVEKYRLLKVVNVSSLKLVRFCVGNFF